MGRVTRSAAAGPWSAPVTWLPPPLYRPERAGRAILIGWLTAFVPSMMLAAAVSALLPGIGQPQLPVGTWTGVFLVAVFAPVLETLIMAGVLALLSLVLPATAAALVSAALWGAAHSLAAPAWGLVVWWPFLIFSILYLTWRQRSLLAALAIPATVHAMQNFLPAALLFAAK